MSPAAVFARAAARPAMSSPSAAIVRRMAAAGPTKASNAFFTPKSFSTSSTTQPSYSTASFMASSFRRAAHRAGASGSKSWRTGGSSGSRRWQSSEAGSAPKPSWFQRMWDSPVGLKTVHFWAPVMKWVLVLAGVSDFARPAEKLSATQNAALTATGLIWTRWCLIIKPKNYLLAAVNFFLGIVGVIQCARIGLYWQGVRSGKIAPPVEEEEPAAAAAPAAPAAPASN